VNNIVLNVQAPVKDKCDDIKYCFYEEVDRAFDQFPKNHMKIFLGDFYANVGREDSFKPIIGNESLQETNDENGIRVNFDR
jgi:hypothetical protein